MVVVTPAWAMLPEPALTCPPEGAACARGSVVTEINKETTKEPAPNNDLRDILAFFIASMITHKNLALDMAVIVKKEA